MEIPAAGRHIVLARDGSVLAAREDGGALVVDAIPLRRAPTDLRAVLHSALDVIRRQAEAFDVTLNVVVDATVPQAVSLDSEKIKWAVAVLAGNALRYVRHGSQMMPGGSVTVHATYDPTIGEIVLAVQDDGVGIPADRLPFLFNDGPNQPRVGLGLSMVRDVVAAHGGRVDVQSDTDPFRRGTTIRLTLPVS